MRPQFLIFIFAVVLLIVALLFWRRPVQPPTKTEQPATAVQPTPPPMNAPVTPVATHPTIQAKPQSVIVSNSDARRQAIVEQFIAQKNGSIDFYGRFIDQDSNGLSGVTIKVSILTLTLPTPETGEPVGSTETYVERTSDTDGRFEISGETGEGFDVTEIQRDGYDVEPGQRSFGYQGGSYENPVIFKMWPTNLHENLITGRKSFHIVPDGRPYFVNLKDGTINESGAGDLKVWVKRPAQVTYGTRYDWSSEVDVINGGLQDAPDYAMWMAPANGYVPSFQFEQTVGSGWGDSTGERRFYVTLNNGQEYGSITIEVYAYYNNQIPGLIRLSYAVNPSGSRILR